MSSNQEVKSAEQNPTQNPTEDNSLADENQSQWKTQLGAFFSSWKFKLGVVLTSLVMFFLLVFFWSHLMAVTGMKLWASSAKAKPIECMIKDTNSDEYISCTALLDGQVVPLECGTSILNLGCRVNYGTASPSIRSLKIKK